MATNSSRGNPIAAADGPPVQNTRTPPHVPETLKSAIRQEEATAEASGGLSAGLHSAGQDANAVPPGGHVETVGEVAGQSRAAGRKGVQAN
ncbi:hypothetical protein C7999DRAFT_16958 [Corynascus novoguineensis]|uniref:Uncharacterized protein n=1 Tax=Corynascus novoguineensis TaxID=1126955 RepID=A0AAN7CMH5_9PEZI|nr:hypothetical protein C7999DRAFT_16958 [Corynascus novoguineensis]